MTRKGADKVTVKDVVESCGITRQTFNYHFQDLLDVIAWGLQHKADEAVRRGLEAENIEDALPQDCWKITIEKLSETDRKIRVIKC